MRGIVYEITSAIGGNRYIGSTTQPLSGRHAGHRSDYKKFKVGERNFCTSFGVIRHGDTVITALEPVEFYDRTQLFARERHYIETRECVNKVIPGRTAAEHYLDNREKLLDYQFKYDSAHHAHRSAKQTCACGGKHTTHHKSSHERTDRHIKWLNDNNTSEKNTFTVHETPMAL